MTRGHPTSNSRKEQAIALAETSLTQEEIAAKVGIGRRTLARIWEKAGVVRTTQESDKQVKRTPILKPVIGVTDPLLLERRKEHHDGLRQELGLFAAHIRVPAPERVVWRPGRSEILYPIAELTKADGELIIRQTLYVHLLRVEGRIRVSLDTEGTEGWRFLQPHLAAETSPPVIDDYAGWLQALGTFFSACRDLLSGVFDQVNREIDEVVQTIPEWRGVGIVPIWGERGLNDWLYGDIYRQAACQEAGDKEAYEIKDIAGKPGLVGLSRAGRGLAVATALEIDALRKVHQKVSVQTTDWKQTRKLSEAYGECRAKSATLLAKLKVIERRGSFAGTCDVCRPWYVG